MAAENERRILLVIETILKAESALSGLAKLETALAGVVGSLEQAGLRTGLDDLVSSLHAVGEARRGLEPLVAALSSTAGAAPKAAAGTQQVAAGTQQVAAGAQAAAQASAGLVSWLSTGARLLGSYAAGLVGAAKGAQQVQAQTTAAAGASATLTSWLSAGIRQLASYAAGLLGAARGALNLGAWIKSGIQGLQNFATAIQLGAASLGNFLLWLQRVDVQLGITRGALSLFGGALQGVGNFFLNTAKSVLSFLNPIRWAQWVVGQFTRSVRILTALLIFQFFRKMEAVVMDFADALIGANTRVELLHSRMATLIGDTARASKFFTVVRDQAIGAGVSLDDLAQATFRFASVSGKNMEVFQELVKRTIALAFYDPQQGLSGAGLAIMEALTGQFRSLVKRFEIGTMEMAARMRSTGMTNIEVLRRIMDEWGVSVALVEDGRNTMSRMFAAIKAEFLEIGRVLGLPIWEYFKEQVRIARDWVFEHRVQLEALATAIGTMLTWAIQRVADLLGDLMDQFKPASWFEWGLNLMYSFASGLLRGAEFIFDVVSGIAQFVADFLMALSPPKRGPLHDIVEGGAGLIREWIRGMQSADLSAITDIAGWVASALSLLEARGVISAEGIYEFSRGMYETLSKALRQLREIGSLSQDMIASLRSLFGELFGDVEAYLAIYTKILEIQREIEAREAAVRAAEELIKAQEKIVDRERETIELARDRLKLAQDELEAFQKRTEGIPQRFLAQRERELESIVDAREAEVRAREERLEAAQEELESRREQLEIVKEFLDAAKEQQQLFADQLGALKDQMNMLEQLWALERQMLQDSEERHQIGIEEAEDLGERADLEKRMQELSAQYLDILREKFAPLRERVDELLSRVRALFMYDEAEGLEGTISRIEAALGRQLTPAEREAVEEGLKLRENLGKIGEIINTQLVYVLDLAKGFLGVGEGESDAYEKGEELRVSWEKFRVETLNPLIRDVREFFEGLLGIGTAAESDSVGFYRLGEVWREVGEKLKWVLDNIIIPILESPLAREIAAWTITIIFLGSKLAILIPVVKGIIAVITFLASGVLAAKLAIVAISLAATWLIICFIRAKGDLKKAIELWLEPFAWLWDKIKELFNKFLDWIGPHSFLSDLTNVFQKGIDTLIRKIKGWFADFINVGRELIGSIVEGVQKGWGELEKVVGKIRDLWPFSPAKAGPFAKPIHWEFLTEGLTSELRRAERALASSAAFEVGPVPMGLGGIRPFGGRELVRLEITNYWDASVSQKDRTELEEAMYRTSYDAMTDVFERAGG